MRILFVEDDKQLRTTVARGLREAEHAVDLATNGTQAMTMATGPGAAGRYDAIVLDILLPGPDGIAICAAIREEGNSVPILMLTALDSVDNRVRGLDAGADDYLVKPFDFDELLARLRALTRRHDPGDGKLKVGDLTIDIARQRARRGKRAIPLSDRELSLLAYLARRAGEVVSRDELMAQVWGEEKTSYSNIVDVYASRLRRKIDDGEEVSLFRTLRGTGYMLEAPGAHTRRDRGAGRSRH